MSLARGSKSALRFKQESTFGVFPGDTGWVEHSFKSEALGGQINEIVSDEIRSDRATPSVRGGNISSGGQLSTDFSLNRFGDFFRHICGTDGDDETITPTAAADTAVVSRGEYYTSSDNTFLCTKTGTTGADVDADLADPVTGRTLPSGTAEFTLAPAGTYYKHTLIPSVDMLDPGIAVEKAILGGNDSLYLKFTGGRINTLNLTIPQEGIVQAAWDFMFAKPVVRAATTSAGTPTRLGDDPVTGYQASILINSVLNGVIKDAALTINNNLDGNNFVVGSRYRFDMTPGRLEVTGTVNALFETSDDYDRFVDEETFTMQFDFAHRGDFFSIFLQECKFFGDPAPKITGPGTITLSFTFRAFVQEGTEQFKIISKNKFPDMGAASGTTTSTIYCGGEAADSFVDGSAVLASALTVGTGSVKAKTITGLNLTNAYVWYLYPKSFGTLQHIYFNDNTSLDYKDSFERTELSIDPNGAQGATDYYLYRSPYAITDSPVKVQFI